MNYKLILFTISFVASFSWAQGVVVPRTEVARLYREELRSYERGLDNKSIVGLKLESTRQAGLALAYCGPAVVKGALLAFVESIPGASGIVKIEARYNWPSLAENNNYYLEELHKKNEQRSFGKGHSFNAYGYSYFGLLSGVADLIGNIRAVWTYHRKNREGHEGLRALSATYMRSLEALEMALWGKSALCRKSVVKSLVAEFALQRSLTQKLNPDPAPDLQELLEESGAASIWGAKGYSTHKERDFCCN